MDLNTITDVVRRPPDRPGAQWREGDAWLAGGTWLFSDQQPAGPMITMTVALEATYTLWAADGSERTVDAADFVTGNHENVLAPGEILRRIDIPVSALRKQHAHRRFTLTRLGRSTLFMIGTRSPGADDLLLTITAGTTRPIRFAFDAVPDAEALQQRIDALPDDVWFDDPNGTPDHRRHLAKHFAEEIRTELAAGDRR
ncbi:MAG: hypothetical protein EOP26_01970 [Rhodococcus sp. (in: high G+C Gram-positive bacteria)]|nr:MAG: hypothetical protein EOP26_01970 [Rhodococcus sp. (in: high G+C Gram-positive bacteria)]